MVAAVGILAAAAAYRLDYAHFRADAAARSLASTMSYAQREAISFQHDMRVAFDAAGGRLRVHEDADNDGVIDNGERVTYADLGDGIVLGRGAAGAMPWGGASINFTRTQGALLCVIFHRDGSASETGGFYINTAKAVAAGSSRDARAIEVTRSTGRVLWYTYNGAAWLRGN